MRRPLKLTGVAAAVILLLLLLAIALLPDAPTSPSAVHPQKHRVISGIQGHPDLYAQYHHAIRASENGENEYPAGYRITEFRMALEASKTYGAKLNWVERGPGNVGGRTRALLVDPDDPSLDTWWAGSVSGGLWKTTDGGLSWQSLTDHLPVLAVSSLAMAESNHNVIYMGTGVRGLGDYINGDGIFRSSDRGVTWEHLAATSANRDFRNVSRLAVDPYDTNVVVAATNSGIFRTSDGGMSWTDVFSLWSIQDLRTQPGNFNMQIAAAQRRGIFYSQDAGRTWQSALSSLAGVSSYRRIELAYSPSDPDIAYAAIQAEPLTQLYRSDDGGRSWAPTVEDADKPNDWLGYQGWWNNALAVHPFNPNIVFAGALRLVTNFVTGHAPGSCDFDDSWIRFVQFGGSACDGALSYMNPSTLDVAESDYATIEIRFGSGRSQKAHRFIVSETAGAYENGGPGVSFSEYMYGGYTQVPFEVWDIDNNRQLMVSFRDQAADYMFNLTEFTVSRNPAKPRDAQSFELLFIHKYGYDRATPQDSIAQDGGLVHGLLYQLWPVLSDGATWHTGSQRATMGIPFSSLGGIGRVVSVANRYHAQPHVDHHVILPIPINPSMGDFWILNANDGGVAISKDNGANFKELDDGAGYNTAQFYGVAKRPGSNIYFAGSQDNGTWRSTSDPNAKSQWIKMLGSDGFETLWHATDPDKMLGSKQYSYILRSDDGGNSWHNSLGTTFDKDDGQFFTSLASSDLAPDNVYTTKRGGVYYSRNFGASWSLTPISEGWGHWNGCTVRVSAANPNVVWAGCGLDSYPDRTLHVSHDSGISFGAVKTPNVQRAPETVISGLAMHPTEVATAYALFSRWGSAKVLETKDYGQSWTDLSEFDHTGESTNGFPNVAVYDLVVMPHSTNVIWVGTEIGVFRSTDYGKQWYYADDDLPAVPVWRIKVRDNEVVVATHGRGVWTVPLGEVDTRILAFSRSVNDQVFTDGATVAPIQLPELTGGESPVTYELSPGLPAGLDYNAATRTISGTPTVTMASTSYTYTATDAYSKNTSVTFSITVVRAVHFFVAGIPDQSFARARRIAPLVLPEAVGGLPPITYTLTPVLPFGLSFNDTTRTISGTPKLVTDAITYQYVGTGANGSADTLMFNISVYSPVDAQGDASLPETFALRGNYPNPFRSTTQIVFDLPSAAKISVDVLDVAGRRVLSVPSQAVQAGWERSIDLSGASLPSGLYLYRVLAISPEGELVRTGRFIRVR